MVIDRSINPNAEWKIMLIAIDVLRVGDVCMLILI